MEPKKVELSALALERGSEKWSSMVERIASEGIAARHKRLSFDDALRSWLRFAAPAAALAAAVVVVVTWVRTRGEGTSTGAVIDPTGTVLAWSDSDQPPDTNSFLQVFGEAYGR